MFFELLYMSGHPGLPLYDELHLALHVFVAHCALPTVRWNCLGAYYHETRDSKAAAEIGIGSV
jgi:hypothetical protein